MCQSLNFALLIFAVLEPFLLYFNFAIPFIKIVKN